MATLRFSEAGIRPSYRLLSMSDPAPKAKNASGSGLASGWSTILVMPSTFFWGVLLFQASSLPVGRRRRIVAPRTRRTVNGLLYRLR